MAQGKISLMDFLCRANPDINCYGVRKGTNTRYDGDKWGWPSEIKVWEDFDLESLKSMYGGVLQTAFENQSDIQDFSDIPKFPFCEIHDEDSFESLAAKWNQAVVSHGLAKAQMRLESRKSRESIYMAKGGQAKALLPMPLHKDTIGKKKESKYPDWAGIKRTVGTDHWPNRDTENVNILPGDTKLSKKWESCKINPGPVEKIKANLWPIVQIYTYCVCANARYGYLITDKELVVVRISQHSVVIPDNPVGGRTSTTTGRAKRQGTLEYRSVPWSCGQRSSQSGGNEMTVNLALWWLHMLAAAGHEIEDCYPPLGMIANSAASFESFTSFETESQELRTPPSQGIEFQDLNQSFRSATWDVRAQLSNARIDSQSSEKSPMSDRPSRKRSRSDRTEEVGQRRKSKRRGGVGSRR
ncbi:MAG: hypothetical protein LQ342_008466 [Letrouitia transgressa]|nr:MAG: hypothetical protein LQ342_008466 [Letrouitia transgressa]